MATIGAIIVLLIIIAILFVMKYLAIIVPALSTAAILALIIYALGFAVYDRRIKKVVRAHILGQKPIIKTVSEKTGHTQSYGQYYGYHEHFRDVDVIVGYNVTFSVEFANGEKDTITCKKDGYAYKKLIKKTF